MARKSFRTEIHEFNVERGSNHCQYGFERYMLHGIIAVHLRVSVFLTRCITDEVVVDLDTVSVSTKLMSCFHGE